MYISLQSQSPRLAAKYKNPRFTIRQSTTSFMRVDDERLLTKSCEISMFTKSDTIFHYEITKRPLVISG